MIDTNNIELEVDKLTKQVIRIALTDADKYIKENIIMIADKFPRYHNYTRETIEKVCPDKINIFNMCLLLK